MIMLSLALLLKYHVPACYAGFALMYASHAVLHRRHLPHAIAYSVGAVLACALAVCAVPSP